jgi:hypothetical protein
MEGLITGKHDKVGLNVPGREARGGFGPLAFSYEGPEFGGVFHHGPFILQDGVSVKLFSAFLLAPLYDKVYAPAMGIGESLFREIDDRFHPRSVAIVGLPREKKSGSILLKG